MRLLGSSVEKVKDSFRSGELTISLFGLGKMGLPLASVFADEGATVVGVDVDEDVVKKINECENPVEDEPGLDELVAKNVSEGRLEASLDGAEAVSKADFHVILVPTLVDERGNVELDPVFDAAGKIAEGLDEGDVVVTEATMPPGTTESLVDVLEESGLEVGEFGLGHAPERTMTGTAVRDIRGQYPKIIGGDSGETSEVLKGVYEIVNSKGVVEMPSIISAEAVKVFEGVYRDVNIALANELALYCEEKGIDALEVFEAANSQPYCDIHEPGAGVGGHCIPVYPWFVMNQMEKKEAELLSVARKLNDSMAYHVVDLVVRGLNGFGSAVKGSRILVLGLTFRGGVREFFKTPAVPVIEELDELGAEVYAYDPLCDEEDALRFGAEWKEDFEGVDAAVILTDHDEFAELDLDEMGAEMSHKLIIDGRNVLDEERTVGEGFTYLRVGNLKKDRQKC